MDELGPWSAQLRKGAVELLILHLLEARGPLHGYGVAVELRKVGPIVAGENTIYPLLRRLEGDGLVRGAWSTEAPGNPRKYYEITDEGRRFLGLAAAEWDALVKAMTNVRGKKR
jgi:PadR family transcriptional regulator, regulatory protein PadR